MIAPSAARPGHDISRESGRPERRADRTGPAGRLATTRSTAADDYTWQSGDRSASGRAHPRSRLRAVRARQRRCGRHVGRCMTADDRRFEVLRAIVSDYVATREPVGSKALVERHHLGRLAGHHPQRHGRAGGRGLHRPAAHLRRPDPHRQGLPAVRRPAVAGQAAVRRRAQGHPGFLSEAVDLDDVLRRSVRLLAQLTRQVAVVQYPTLARSVVRHVEAVALDPRRLLLVVITDTGRVEQRVDRAARRHHRRRARRPCARCWPRTSPAAGSPRPPRRSPRSPPWPTRPVGTSWCPPVGGAAGRARRAPGGAAGAVRHLARHRRLGRPAGQPARRAGGAGRAGDAAQAAGRAGHARMP